MTATALSQQRLPIVNEDDIVIVRKKAREVAEQVGFDAFATAAIVTAASELARNVWRHANRGGADITVVEDRGRLGVKLDVVDEGPGIADLDRAMAGGNSTVRSLGLGLVGSRRLADEFSVDTVVGKGTHVMFLKWKRR